MGKGTLRGTPPMGCSRALLRAPVWLYRLGLGWLLGGRFLMIEHTGRSSGKRRYTVVEVVRHDRDAGAYVVASGWGRKADWYRNVMVTPQVRIQTGGRRLEAYAVALPEAEAARELCTYARTHPRAYAAISRILVGGAGVPCEQAATQVPVLVFKIRESGR